MEKKKGFRKWISELFTRKKKYPLDKIGLNPPKYITPETWKDNFIHNSEKEAPPPQEIRARETLSKDRLRLTFYDSEFNGYFQSLKITSQSSSVGLITKCEKGIVEIQCFYSPTGRVNEFDSTDFCAGSMVINNDTLPYKK